MSSLVLALFFILSNSSPALGCSGSIFVEEPIIVSINGSSDLNCKWLVETRPDRTLMFTVSSPRRSAMVLEHVTIFDGPDRQSAISWFGPQSKQFDSSSFSVYSTGPVGLLTSNFEEKVEDLDVRIQPAVLCPLYIGDNSSCCRILNDGGCHCVSWVKRTWTESKSYCESKDMQLVSIESQEEDKGLENAWTSADLSVMYWTSGSDDGHEGFWIWTATGKPYNYANWYPKEPNNLGSNEHYLHKNIGNTAFWNHLPGSNVAFAICEASS